MYLAWAKLAPGRWLIAAVLVQMHVIIVATQFRVYWAGEHYLWTISVVAAAVVLIGRLRRRPDALAGREVALDA